jgi:ADP-ribose pyrophosphatase
VYLDPNGERSEWDVLDAADSAAILAFTPEAEHVVFFEQFRVGPEKTLLEIPGGAIEAGESAADAALRELREETGYAGGSVYVPEPEWFTSNSNRRKFVAVVAGATRVTDTEWDAHEMGETRLVPAEDLLGILLAGELTDAGTACRALLAFLREAHRDPVLARLQEQLRRRTGLTVG